MGAAAIGAQVAGTVLQAGAAKDAAEAQRQRRQFEIAQNMESGRAQAQTYDYQAAVAANNELIAKWQEADARERGQVTASRIGLSVRQLEGKQKADFAARGVDFTDGSALHILEDTRYMGAVDIQTAEHNTEVESYAFKVAAQNAAGDSALLKRAAENARRGVAAWAGAPQSNANGNRAALGTLLGGAGSVASTWYNLNSKGAFGGSSSGGGAFGYIET